VNATLARIGEGLKHLLQGRDRLETVVSADGPDGDILVPSAGDGRWELVSAGGRTCLAPDEESHYLYFVLPESFRRRAGRGLFVEVEYYGAAFGEFRLHYASTATAEPWEGLYKPAEQRWAPEAVGLSRFRRAVFALPDFDPTRTQNEDASFRLEYRSDLRVSRVTASLSPLDASDLPAVAPLPELRKMPGRFYPINYLFIEITNACNFKCTWCPDEIMSRRRGFMKKEKVFRILDELAEKKAWLGPIYPVKLHQMGEPMLHPELADIVGHAEGAGVPIELNTNCGLITKERVDALYRAGLTNLILSYQTPDAVSFKTRKAPRLVFDEYRDKVRLAVERKVALRARTHLEIDIMNTKNAHGEKIVSEDEQALAFLKDWIEFARRLEERYGLSPIAHDWDRIRSAHFLDHDENGSRYPILDGVDLIWKRLHTWGNVFGDDGAEDARMGATVGAAPPDTGEAVGATGRGGPETGPTAAAGHQTYCPAPYDQFVIHWNGDVVSCCTDYEGGTKTANVFAHSVEGVWRSRARRNRLRDMLGGNLLDVCARCQGLK